MAAFTTALTGSGQLCSAEMGNRLNLLSLFSSKGFFSWLVLEKSQTGLEELKEMGSGACTGTGHLYWVTGAGAVDTLPS